MKRALLAAAIYPLLGVSAAAARVENFALLDQNGVFRELYRYGERKAVVLIVHGNGCPIFEKSLPEIAELRKRYGPQGVAFLMLNANLQDSRESVARSAKNFNLDTPILMDESQRIAKSLGIIRTAEALLIDPKDWSLVYRGAIDDRLSYGGEKPEATKHYLADALDAVLAGRKPAAEQAQTLGCLIRFENVEKPNYIRDAMPVLMRRCLRCHWSEFGSSPLISYEKVKGWAPMIRETVRTGLMPPNAADPHIGDFPSNSALTPEETRRLLAWTESDLARGGGPDQLAEAAANYWSHWLPGPPDRIYEIEVPNYPDNPEQPFRFVLLDANFPEDFWVRGVHTKKLTIPDTLLHEHILVLSKEVGARYLRYAVPDLAPMTRSSDAAPYLYVLPTYAVEGTKQLIPAGSQIILKIHYPFPKSTTPGKLKLRVGLYRHKNPATARKFVEGAIDDKTFSIPARSPAYETTRSKTFDHPMLLYCLNFHMHQRGMSASLAARYPNGRRELLASVPRYYFHTPQVYCYNKPKAFPAHTTFIGRWEYDNSARNRYNPDPDVAARYGMAYTDEMMEVLMNYTIPEDASK